MKQKTILPLSTIFVGILLIVIFLNFTSAVTIKDVSSLPTETAPGEVVSVVLEIENTFDYDVTNLNVKLDLNESPFAPYQSSAEEFLDKLDSEDDDKFSFKLIVLPETASGIYKIPVAITYKDEEGIAQTKTGVISLTVNSKPELKISLEDGVIIKGTENEITIKIVNSGLADVRFFYLTASEVTGIKILSEKTQYIGDIDSDDFDSIKYKTYISKDASNFLNLPVLLRYKDATNKEFTETKTISIRVYSLKEAQDLGLAPKSNYIIYGTIGFLVIVYFIYRWRKKRRLRKLRESR